MAKSLQCSQLNIVAPKPAAINLQVMADKSGLLYTISNVPNGTSFTFWGDPAELTSLMCLLNTTGHVHPQA
jgi:hypothetical protein